MKIFLLEIFTLFFAAIGICQDYDFKQKIVDPNRVGKDIYGFSVSVKGEYAVVGELSDSEDLNELNPLDSSGSVHVYHRENNLWSRTSKITPADRHTELLYGHAVEMENDEMFVSAVGSITDSLSLNPLLPSGAVYVYSLVAGNFVQTQKITAPDRNGLEQFGFDIEVSDGWLVIGASNEDLNVNGTPGPGSLISGAGAAYIYKKNTVTGRWDFYQKIQASVRRPNDQFGESVAIDDNVIIIGAKNSDYDENELNSSSNAGSAYIYRLSGGVWSFEQKVAAPFGDRVNDPRFGEAVCVNKDLITVSASQAATSQGNDNSGKVYIYNYNSGSGNWVLSPMELEFPSSISSLFPFGTNNNRAGYFGVSMQLTDTKLVVGAPAETNFFGTPAYVLAGSVYLYDHSGGVISPISTEVYSTPRVNQAIFSAAISLDSNVLFVGAPGAGESSTTVSADTAGAAYIFEQCIHSNIPQVQSVVSICEGDSVQLVVNSSSDLHSAEEWYWYTGTYGSGVLVDSTDTIWVSPTTTTTYTVAGEGYCVQSGLSDSSTTVTVTVNQLPTLSVSTTPSASICSGESVTLTASGAATYVWDNSVTNGVAFSPTATATYKVIGTSSDGCKDSTTQDVTISPSIVVGINYTGSNIICSGTSITLAGTGATSYSWNNGVSDGVSFTPLVTNTYTVTGTSTLGCANTEDITITVVSGPSVNANSGLTTICEGEQVSLSAMGADTYVWDNGLGAGQTHTVSPNVTTKYFVTGTQTSTMCTDIDSITITVNPRPTVVGNAASNDSLCLGESLTLSGSGAISYTWDNGVIDGVVFTPSLGSVDYEVIGTDANNCSNSAIINVKVFNLPTITASVSPAGSVCFGDQVTLKGFGGVTYLWDSSGTDIGIVDGVPFIPSTGNNVFNLTGIDANGCAGTAIQSVTVNPEPTVGAFSSAGGLALCEGDSLRLTATGNAQSYSWNNGVVDNVYFSPASGTTLYTLTGTSANQCQGTASVSVVVNVQEDATVIPILPLCGGVPIENLQSVTSGGTWQGIGVDATSGAFDASIAGEGIHQIIYTTTGACNDADTIYIEVYPELIVNALIDSVCFGDSDGDAGVEVIQGVAPYAYLWESGEDSPVITGLGEGIYSVEVKDANNCLENLTVAIQLTEDCDYHEFLPNVFSPNGDGLNDVFYVRGKGFESMSIVIFDRWGNKMFESTDKDIGWDGTNNGKKINSDVYVYHLEVKYYNGETIKKDGNVLLAY